MEISSLLSSALLSECGLRSADVPTLRVERPTHEFRQLRACPCELRLHCSFGHSQKLCGLTRSQRVKHTQLIGRTQRRRELLHELHQASSQLRLPAFIFRSWCIVRQHF